MNTVLRRAAVAPVRIMQRRNAGGHHGPAPTYTGVEAKIRKFLPRDSHMALGYLGFYVGLYALSKAFSGKAKPAAAPAAVAANDGDMPSIESPAFGEWVGKDGNLEKLINSA